jgi:FtsZ-interacting cell division protein ZipA
MDMTFSFSLVSVIVSILVLSALVVVIFWVKRQLDESHQRSIELTKRLADVEQQTNDNDEANYEVRTGAIGLGEKVKEISASVDRIDMKILELEQQDPANKVYNRAAQLVAQGVTIEELMQECDLPRAEAQLLFDLHKK